uniref:Flavin-containing amine oxidase n=1 Tax=Pithovirus LCPAC403 TaxID=2506596 RepID=A0A481ZBU9_9VIRU|nr:MAG: flavin-containing amine oxidase [Pithovirus LCPAC403]
MEKVKIIIIGGGLGGMSVAQNLITRGFKDITLYERNQNTGGMARSKRLTKDDMKPISYCWRIVGASYKNMRAMMRKIPVRNGNSEDRLVDMQSIWFIINSTCVKIDVSISTIFGVVRQLKTLCLSDLINISRAYLYGLTACKERIDLHDDETWEDFIGHLSKDVHMLIVESLGPMFGVDPHRVNASSIMRALENLSAISPNHSQVMDTTWDEGLFKPWEEHLKKLGVKIFTEMTIDKIDVKNDKITRIHFVGIGNKEKDEADVYFICLPVEQAHKLLKSTRLGESLRHLKNNGKQLMTNVAIYFEERLFMKENRTAIYIPHTPWRIVIEPCGVVWNEDIHRKYGVGDVWYAAIDCQECKGTLYKKRFLDCSPREVKEEIMHQIYSSGLDDFLTTSSGKKFSQVEVIEVKLWPTYVEGKDGKIFTTEPKFSSNKNTLKFRPHPDITDYIENAYMATSYCRTSREAFLMDGAFESSAIACNAFMDKIDKDKTIERVTVYSGHRKFGHVFGPLRKLDNLLLKNNLPHIGSKIHPIFIILLYFYFIYLAVRAIF